MQPETTRPGERRAAGRTAVALLVCLAGAGAASLGLAATAPGAHAAVAASNGPHAPSDPAAQLTTGMMPPSSPDAVAARSSEASSPSAAHVAVARTAASPAAVASDDALGVDIASYQHPGGQAITWSQVRASGQSFAIVKATEGTTYTNTWVTSDTTGARAAGLTVGLYHFARPGLVGGSPTADAVSEADHFATQIRAVGGTQLPPTLDLEVTGGLAPSQLAAWTGSFLTRVQSDTGRRPMIYTGPYFWNDDVQSSSFGSYPLWEAHYTSASSPLAVRGWSTWTIWQYTDGAYGSPAAVPGIAATVDRDRLHGSAANLPSVAASSAGSVAPFTATASAAAYPDGLLIRVAGTNPVYEVVGGAPVYAPTFADVGSSTVRTITAAQLVTLRSSPADGTFIRSHETGQIYRVAGGAPIYLSSMHAFPGARVLSVGQADVQNAGIGGVWNHLLAKPVDGTFLRSVETNAVWRVAGGAPVYVSSWSYFGGGQPTTDVTDETISRAGASSGPYMHLRFTPAVGTYIADATAGTYWVVGLNSHLVAITNTGQGFVVEGDTAIVRRGTGGAWSHLL